MAWKHFLLKNEENAQPIEISKSRIHYPLVNHFVGLYFSNENGSEQISLRATMIGVGSSWGSAEFTSKHVGSRVDTDFPKNQLSLDLDVECTRTN